MTTRRWIRKWYEKQKLQRFHSCFILEAAEDLDESADPETEPDDDEGLWLSGDAFTFTPLELIQNSPLDLIGSKDDFLRVERCLRKNGRPLPEKFYVISFPWSLYGCLDDLYVRFCLLNIHLETTPDDYSLVDEDGSEDDYFKEKAMKIWNMCTACFNTYISEPEYVPDPEDEPIVLVSSDLLPGPITVEKYQFALFANYLIDVYAISRDPATANGITAEVCAPEVIDLARIAYADKWDAVLMDPLRDYRPAQKTRRCRKSERNTDKASQDEAALRYMYLARLQDDLICLLEEYERRCGDIPKGAVQTDRPAKKPKLSREADKGGRGNDDTLTPGELLGGVEPDKS